ncbi:MAG: HD domain-containing protein [Mycobacterium leprae]
MTTVTDTVKGRRDVETVEWLFATGGVLTPAQRRELIRTVPALLRDATRNWIAVARGREATRVADPGSTDRLVPDSTWAGAAERACDAQVGTVRAHCYRTWAYAAMLAVLDGAAPDWEALYVGCLLHDLGLDHPRPPTCFTLRGVQTALDLGARANVPPDRQHAAAQAICAHSSPDARVDVHGLEACYVRAGALADLVAHRARDIGWAGVRSADRRWPRDGCAGDLARRLRAEAAAVPEGRMAFACRWLGLPLAIRLADRLITNRVLSSAGE